MLKTTMEASSKPLRITSRLTLVALKTSGASISRVAVTKRTVDRISMIPAIATSAKPAGQPEHAGRQIQLRYRDAEPGNAERGSDPGQIGPLIGGVIVEVLDHKRALLGSSRF